MTAVLDASAVMAVLREEAGGERVLAHLPGAVLGAANFAEVIGKLLDADIPVEPVRRMLENADVRIEPVTDGDGLLAGQLRGITGGRQLSLGDRCCLALALRIGLIR
ncbi:MAG: type II toxin-antitoxin system VapC family toxin [Aeromicrobium sp.]|uniref:type II toxin-antitoxin system VapC family toxin n=1 Tax=Aeromicrobium sp. TaxID=1871063 RepID=UPI0039E49C50